MNWTCPSHLANLVSNDPPSFLDLGVYKLQNLGRKRSTQVPALFLSFPGQGKVPFWVSFRNWRPVLATALRAVDLPGYVWSVWTLGRALAEKTQQEGGSGSAGEGCSNGMGAFICPLRL
jgi:hypothetical protein